MSGQTIRLADVSKSWGDTTAVDGISVEVPAGTFTVLLGPSGCGKSTTLRIIAGLESVDAGRVEIGGRDVSDLPAAKRDLSMVFQSYALFPHLSVADNIAFGLQVRRVGRAEQEERLREVADLLELTDKLNRKPAELSGGQQQRVALGRAIISRRPVCLMDEPLSNLDARLRHDMRTEIRALQRQLGFTMVYVTHDQVEAITMADQVVLMNRGRIEQAADPRTIYAEPASTFAARFIGTPPMNILAAGAFGDRLKSPDALASLIGVRPEALTLRPDGPLAAEVTGVEFLGADMLLDCVAGGENFIVRTSGSSALSVGTAVTLGFDPADLHVFDLATGLRRDDRQAAVAAELGSP
ncbi:MAG: ABC transporter ATP-binding protein [Pseudomonadota bacterium]